MEVMVPAASFMDFEFNSARSSPRSTAPSTPRRFGDCYFSAPTSPSRMSELYLEFERYSMMNDRQSSIGNSSLAIPFNWEEKPGTPKSPKSAPEDDDDDFAFDFSAETSLPAEELFDGGKIKPLKPPPRLQVDEYNQKSPLLSSPRSASEGRAADKDPLRKYSSAFFKKPEEIKNSSFRSTDSSGSNGGSRRKVSAHELHYTTNKAVSENMKKKTFLPYKQGILGRLAFNPAVHALANGFGTLTRSSS
ncbi:hypothetical protein COLO4_26453 [Corchorus olitorius]|uniref:Uncharacterized protein n=1 Tax=Corchorus olitorius TaxID=93759 RepID=A0A1R3HWZ6_9ROSI|nr:hypothetical protein COLO4_26453 [Corchorus olitorius]